MNQPIANGPEDEAILRRLLCEGGDPHVSPRPEYADRLRGRIIDRLQSPRRLRRTAAPWLVGVGVAVATMVLIGVLVTLGPQQNAWARIAEAMQARRWIHTETTGPGGSAERWVNLRDRVLASRYDFGAGRRGSAFHDYQLGVVTKYLPDEGAIYRLPESEQAEERMTEELDISRQLLRGEALTESPIRGTKIVDQKGRRVEAEGRAWQEYTLILQKEQGPGDVAKLTMRLQVDPETGLPRSEVLESEDGQLHRTTFDYPDSGPTDIYDLGAPRTAEVIDRVPSDHLERLLAGLKAGRTQFDDYRAIVVERGGSDYRRVWRKGRKWRVEQLLSPRDGAAWPPPADADRDWWAAHQEDYTYTVLAICDGETTWFYRLKDDQWKGPKSPPPPDVRLTGSHEVGGPADDPTMPWPHLFPEYLGHPQVWLPSEERTFLLEPVAEGGPPGTVLLRVRDTRPRKESMPDLYRLWVDPKQGYLSLRTDSSVFTGQDDRLAFVDTQAIEAVVRSPNGHWYPTKARRTTSKNPHEQVTRFLLEFDAAVPGDLFRPLEP